MSAALDIASIKGSAGAPAGLAALAASLLPAGRPARKGSYPGSQQRPGAGAQAQPPRRRAAPWLPAGTNMRGKEEKSSLKGGFAAPPWPDSYSPRGKKKTTNPPSSRSPRSDAPGDTGGYGRGRAGAALGTNTGRVTWPEQRSPCRQADTERGRGRCCGPLERGRLRAAWGPRLSRAVGVSLCRTAGGICCTLPGAGNRLHLCTAGRNVPGDIVLSLEMPEILLTLSCGSRVVFNSSTLKTVRRGRENCPRLFQSIKRGFFEDSFEPHTLL